MPPRTLAAIRDFSDSFPPWLANLDVQRTRIGVLAQRAGVTRQAAEPVRRDRPAT